MMDAKLSRDYPPHVVRQISRDFNKSTLNSDTICSSNVNCLSQISTSISTMSVETADERDATQKKRSLLQNSSAFASVYSVESMDNASSPSSPSSPSTHMEESSGQMIPVSAREQIINIDKNIALEANIEDVQPLFIEDHSECSKLENVDAMKIPTEPSTTIENQNPIVEVCKVTQMAVTDETLPTNHLIDTSVNVPVRPIHSSQSKLNLISDLRKLPRIPKLKNSITVSPVSQEEIHLSIPFQSMKMGELDSYKIPEEIAQIEEGIADFADLENMIEDFKKNEENYFKAVATMVHLEEFASSTTVRSLNENNINLKQSRQQKNIFEMNLIVSLNYNLFFMIFCKKNYDKFN